MVNLPRLLWAGVGGMYWFWCPLLILPQFHGIWRMFSIVLRSSVVLKAWPWTTLPGFSRFASCLPCEVGQVAYLRWPGFPHVEEEARDRALTRSAWTTDRKLLTAVPGTNNKWAPREGLRDACACSRDRFPSQPLSLVYLGGLHTRAAGLPSFHSLAPEVSCFGNFYLCL